MKTLTFFLAVIFLSGCFFGSKDDIVTKRYNTAELKEDLKILQGIITDMHAGAYAYNTPAQLKHIFDSISQSVDAPLTIREFYSKVDYIMDRLRCIHTQEYLPDAYYDSISNRPIFFPTPVVDIDGHLYANSDVQKIPLGAEIVSINDVKATTIINKLKTYYHTDGYSNEAKKAAIDEDFSYNFFLAYGGTKEYAIDFIEDSSNTVKRKIFLGEKLKDINNEIGDTRFFYYARDVDYDLEIDDEYNAATITIRSFSFSSYNAEHAFNNFLSNSFRLIRQNGIKNLIIDCRNNGGGYYGPTYSLLSYLVNKTLPESDSIFQRFKKLTYKQYIAEEDTGRIAEEDTAYLSYKKQNNGLYKLIDSNIKRWEPKPDIFKGRLFVIINGHVISAAATFASILKDNTNAMFFGEETGGGSEAHNASVISFVLPNTKIKLDIPLRTYYQPVINRQPGRGVFPDKKILLTREDLIKNFDQPISFVFDSIIVK